MSRASVSRRTGIDARIACSDQRFWATLELLNCGDNSVRVINFVR